MDIPSPKPAIKPVANLKVLLLPLKPKNWVVPSKKVGIIMEIARKIILKVY